MRRRSQSVLKLRSVKLPMKENSRRVLELQDSVTAVSQKVRESRESRMNMRAGCLRANKLLHHILHEVF